MEVLAAREVRRYFYARGFLGCEIPRRENLHRYRDSADGKKLVWPATAPTLNQTVIAR
jgi:hypothetical protein